MPSGSELTHAFPSERNTMWDVGPEILISISADCSPSLAENPFPIRLPREDGTVTVI
jgi:hypothetical protein